jgi:hypothetical protein
MGTVVSAALLSAGSNVAAESNRIDFEIVLQPYFQCIANITNKDFTNSEALDELKAVYKAVPDVQAIALTLAQQCDKRLYGPLEERLPADVREQLKDSRLAIPVQTMLSQIRQEARTIAVGIIRRPIITTLVGK